MPKFNRIESKSMHHLNQFDATWKEWTLANGLRCLHIPLPEGDLRFQMTLMIGCGSRYEPKNLSGISHLLEHMMFRGSAKYPSFSELSIAFESIGGEWNAATGHEYTEFFYNGTSANIQEVTELFSDFILRPAFQDLETERRIVLRELEGEWNENGVSTDPDFHTATQVWPNSSMSTSIIGSPETLGKISLDDVRNWYESHYIPKNAVLCVVGGKIDEIQNLIDLNFCAWKNLKNCPTKGFVKQSAVDFQGPISQWVENSDSEYQVQLSFVCEGTGSPKTASYELITRILADGFSSRLTRRIREELGLVYDISANIHQYEGTGLVNIAANVLGENLKPFFKELFAVIDELKTHGFSEDELNRHKHRSLVDLDMTTAEPAALAWRGGWAILSNTDSKLSFWAQKIAELTKDELQLVIRELLIPEKMCVVALGPDDDNMSHDLNKIVKKWQCLN